MFNSKAFRTAIWILTIFIIIFVGTHISFIFIPLIVLVQTIFLPVLIAGVLFYLLRPVVNLLEKFKIHRVVAILIIYLVFFGILVALAIFLGPIISSQVAGLIEGIPSIASGMQKQLLALEDNEIVARLLQMENISMEEIADNFSSFIRTSSTAITTNIAHFAGAVANLLIIFVTIPIILFYMLKEGEKLPRILVYFIPEEHKEEGLEIIVNMDKTLSSYIQGIIIVSLSVGVMVFVGFSFLGLNYALLLSIVAAMTNVVPFFGPFIGTIPAIIVGFVQSPLMALKVLGIVIVAQQIESNLLSPQVMGKKLAIHPVVIILLIMAAGRFAGLLGLILAVPTFAVLRVVVVHIYRLIRLRRVC